MKKWKYDYRRELIRRMSWPEYYEKIAFPRAWWIIMILMAAYDFVYVMEALLL